MKKILLGLVVGFIILFSVNVRAGSIELKWNPSPESDLGGYKLYYTEEGGAEQMIDVANVITYKLIGLTTGAYYVIEITAYDSNGGESNRSYGVRAKAKYSKVEGLEVIG